MTSLVVLKAAVVVKVPLLGKQMDLHNIELSATESNWRLFQVRKADPAFRTFQLKVFARDRYTCQYCGFVAKEHMDVVNLDGDYRNNRQDNLVTACEFCSQCFFLEAVGKGDFGGGNLICLPEMTQAELNALSHVLFSGIFTGSSFASQARNIYRSLRLRSQLVEQQLGEGLSNPILYGRLLVDAADLDHATQVSESLREQLRLLPDMRKFNRQVQAWSSSALDDLTYSG